MMHRSCNIAMRRSFSHGCVRTVKVGVHFMCEKVLITAWIVTVRICWWCRCVSRKNATCVWRVSHRIWTYIISKTQTMHDGHHTTLSYRMCMCSMYECWWCMYVCMYVCMVCMYVCMYASVCLLSVCDVCRRFRFVNVVNVLWCRSWMCRSCGSWLHSPR